MFSFVTRQGFCHFFNTLSQSWISFLIQYFSKSGEDKLLCFKIASHFSFWIFPTLLPWLRHLSISRGCDGPRVTLSRPSVLSAAVQVALLSLGSSATPPQKTVLREGVLNIKPFFKASDNPLQKA